MNLLPKNTPLGEIRILEVFEYYDIPLLFVCTNTNGQLFIAVSLNDGETIHEWLYTPISDIIALKLRKGLIDFREAFLTPVSGVVFNVLVHVDGKADVIIKSTSDLPKEWLPYQGERVNPEKSEDIVPYNAEVKQAADSTNRGIFNFILEFPDEVHEASARVLGNIITKMQELVDAIGYKASGQHKLLGRIPQFIIDQTDLRVAFSFPGSFGVQVRSAWRSGNPEFTLIEQSMVTMIGLISTAEDEDTLKENLRVLERRVVGKYSEFLESISNANVGIRCQLGTPSKEKPLYASISHQQIESTLKIAREIESEFSELTVHGRLRGVFLDPYRFKITDANSHEYSGDIYPEAIAEASRATINNYYKATLIKESIFLKAKNTYKYKWHLLALESTIKDQPALLESSVRDLPTLGD